MVQQVSYNTAYEDTGPDPLEQAIRDYIATNPSPAELAAAMAQYGVSAEQISGATGYTVEQVNNYVAPAQPEPSPAPVAPEPEPVYTPPPQTVTAPVAPPVEEPPVYRAPVVEAPVAPPQAQYSAPAPSATQTTTTTTTTPPTVAQVTAAIDKWQTDNPGASSQQLATAIKNGMGMTPEVTQALANKYNMSTTDVTAAYNDLITRPPEVLPPTVAQVTAAIDKWSTDNPGATPAQLATAIKNGMGMTDTVAQALAAKYNMPATDVVKSYNELITQTPVSTPVAPTTTETKDPYAGVAVKDYRGQSYSASDLIKLATQVAQNLDVSKSSGGAFGTSKENIGFDYGTLSSAFGGKSFTSGDQVAFDIARQLLDQGITNYDQVKNAKKTTITEQQFTGSGEDQQVFDVQREAYIDPVTGKEIRTDIGSTYTGKGNTQYHIDPATGKFYTTAESSSDVSPEMMMALSIGASFLMPGVGQILSTELGISINAANALANAGLQLAMGADPKTVLLNAGLAVSGVTKGAGNFVQTGLENLTTGLPEGLITEKMLSTAASAITRASTTFLTTGDTSTALTAAAGSVVNDVVTDRTGSNVLGAGAAAYLQTGDLTTAGLVAANAAAFNAGQTYKKDVVDLFNGAKNSVLQTLTADNLANSGITQAALDDLFDPNKNPYLTSTDITQLAATNNTGVVTDAGAGTNDHRVESAWTAGPNGQRRWVEVKGADGTTKYAGWETVGEDGQIYGTITSGGVDKDGKPTDVYVTGLRGGIPINVDVTKSDTAGSFSVKAVKPTEFTLGGTEANATPNVLSQSNAVSTTNNTTSVAGNIVAAGGNVGGTSGNVTGANVITVGSTGGNANVSITGGTGANGLANVGGVGGNVGNIVVGNTGGGLANITVGGTGGNGNANIGNVGGTGNVSGNVGGTGGNVSVVGNVSASGNVTGNTTSNVSTIGNVISTIGNIISDGNVITVLNTPNTTPNVSTPITTTLGTAITPLKFASGGLNPGYIAPTPFYNTTSPTQNKYYWGSHPYQTGGPTGQVFDPVLYNTVPEAPKIPFGSQAVNQPLTSAEIAAIVANPGANNAQQNTQAVSTVPAPVAPPTQSIPMIQPVVQPAPVAPPVQMAPPATPLPGQAVSGMPAPIPVQQPAPQPIAPQQPTRDPQFAGMPDEMYNNMMAYQQRQAEQMARDGYAIDTMEIKPWQMWMMEQNPPELAPPPFADIPERGLYHVYTPESLQNPTDQYAGGTFEPTPIVSGMVGRNQMSQPISPEAIAQAPEQAAHTYTFNQPVAPQEPANPWDTFQLPTGFRYAGGDDMDAGTAIYNPILNGYIAPISSGLGPVAP